MPGADHDRYREVLDGIGIDERGLEAVRKAARQNGTDLASELVASRRFTADDIAAAIARVLSLPKEKIGPGDRIVGANRRRIGGLPRMMQTFNEASGTRLFLLPRLEDLDRTAALLARQPEVARLCRITTAGAVRRAIAGANTEERVDAAAFSLARSQPQASAKRVLTPWQAVCLILAAGIVSAALYLSPAATGAIFHAGAALFFAGCLALRFLAARGRPLKDRHSIASVEHAPWRPAETLPLYTILVALYQESAVVEKLVASLQRLDWPASRLEIKLICESDDRPTQLAVERAIAGLEHFDLVVVPACEPRTKPKALNYALPMTAGKYLVLFDAEDEPDPGQLREAHARFSTAPSQIVGFQAPLVVRNCGEGWLAGMFALEYAGLFRRMLPWLARQGMPLPLGGTSNHFLRSRLVEVGGWDPHNVTEDADLGMRFFRRGYRFGTLRRPTFEDAPERWEIWHKQRTRWNKGWFQTWLVHMREPHRLFREIGWRNAVIFQMLFAGMLLSALAHPIFVVLSLLALARLAVEGMPDGFGAFVLGLDLFNAVGGFAAFGILSYRSLNRYERRTLRPAYPYLPVYWLLIAYATLRAAVQLFVAPHKWEKTPHDLQARANTHDPRHRLEPRLE